MAETEQELQNPTLREELAAAIADARARQSELREFDATKAKKPEPKAAEKAAPDEEPVEAQSEDEDTVEVVAEDTEAEVELPEGPTWLPKEDRELFAQADEHVREAWERNFKALQGNYTRATQELKEKSTKLSRFDQAIAQYRPMIEQAGATPEQAIQYLFNWYAQLATNPKETVQRIAQSVGLSLDTAANAQGFDSGLDDPRIKTLEQRLGQIQQSLLASQRRAAMTEEQKVTSQLTEFAEAKDSDGKPLHPHFERVQQAMIPFVSTGLSLAQAYEKAVRADDELFEQIVAERSRKALQKPAVKKVTSKPKASGSGIVVPKTSDQMTLREEIAAQLAAARARP